MTGVDFNSEDDVVGLTEEFAGEGVPVEDVLDPFDTRIKIGGNGIAG